MKRVKWAIAIIVLGTLLLTGCARTPEDAVKRDATGMKPSEGWMLHIDAKKHFTNELDDPIAHHYCKEVSGGMTECQLYESDKPDARLVGVEVIVDKKTYETFSNDEKAKWHYHKVEVPKVDAVLPEMSKEEGDKVLKSIEETYGKVYILWNPGNSSLPVGSPYVNILD